jgi:hypothetical protein
MKSKLYYKLPGINLEAHDHLDQLSNLGLILMQVPIIQKRQVFYLFSIFVLPSPFRSRSSRRLS